MVANWFGRVLGAVVVIALAGACGQSAPGQELPYASTRTVEAVVALAESPATEQRVAELRQRFVVLPVERPAPHVLEQARESKPKPVIQAGVATGFEREGERVRPLFLPEAKRGVARTASVELPALASGAARLADDTSHLAITFALEGAAEAPIAVADGIARYAGALAGADVVHRVHAEGTEDFVVFEERPAREELRYVVDVSRVAGLRLVGNTVEFLDEAGSPRLRVAPPSVVDAGGERHEASVKVVGCAYDTDPRGPWGRAVTRPGAESCVVRVVWSGVPYPAVVDPAWTATGSMATARVKHTATLLGSGKVLVAGGYDNNSSSHLSSAELYDPSGSGTFAATGPMGTARNGCTATLLISGKVLVAGGYMGTYVSSAELYDPNGSGTFAPTGPMATARENHTATRLASGKVLLAGGYNTSGPLSSAELYDPAGSGTFAPTGSIGTARRYHTATLLISGKVLLAGGDSIGGSTLSSAELYDPSGSGTFAPTSSMGTARRYHTATLFASGKVLLAGGDNGGSGNLSSAELYDPLGSGTFAATGSMGTARRAHTATLLASGKVLIAGGNDSGFGSTSSAELYDPSGAGTFAATSSLGTSRYLHTATRLDSGKVLVAGGYGISGSLSSAELLALSNGESGCSASNQCLSDVCNDGICCSGACNGVCQTCASGSGACMAVTNADDPDTCTGAVTCDAIGMCKSKDGQASSNPATCASGFVADGVCCNTACSGDCDVCTSALGAPADGTCAPAATGYPGNPACGNGLACNGASTLCPASCVSDLDCLATNFCAADGTCQPQKPQAASCNVAANGDCKSPPCRACATGFCADGVCCDTACDTLCQACAGALKQSGTAEGTCGPAKDHTNPHQDACPTSTSSTCGADGMCDGKGGCRLYYPAGTSCGPDASCQNGAQTTATTCDGSGTCAAPTTMLCGAYACGTDDHCRGSCAAESDCAQGFTCDATKCVPKSGSTCKDDHTVLDSKGNPTLCDPYVCSGGACKSKCTSIDDCVSPNVCDAASKQCIAANGESPGETTSCGFRVPGSGSEPEQEGRWLGAALLAGLAFRRLKQNPRSC